MCFPLAATNHELPLTLSLPSHHLSHPSTHSVAVQKTDTLSTYDALGPLSHSMMRKHRIDEVEAACALVGLSLLCSSLAQRSFTQQSELASETICWTIFLALSRSGRWPNASTIELYGFSDIRTSPFTSLWLVAVSLAVSCIYRAENGMIELLVSFA